ncbi:MAG TPA: PilZ domain-containing protein [bacterium]|nr:PilZ domain-containing protein [bacterium]
MSRKTFRIKTLFPARCCFSEPPRFVKGIIRDIGIADANAPGLNLCGCSVSLFETALAAGDTFHMVLMLPDHDIEVAAMVCREKPAELPGDRLYGVSFTNLTDSDRAYLEDWLVEHALEVEFPTDSKAEQPTCADGQYTG